LNFLAHQYLSFDNESLMVGNFIADTIRGKDFEIYPEQIKQGILLHRFIDTFTDCHPLVLDTRKKLYPYFGKYAAVVQDVYYDHFLAVDWPLYHPLPLPAFAKKVYTLLQSRNEVMNMKALRTLHFMELHGWLENYAHLSGIDRSLKGLSRRATFLSNMENSLEPLRLHFDEMKLHFDQFFPELVLEVRKKQ